MSKLSDEDKVGLSPQEIEALEDDSTPGSINDKPNEPALSEDEIAADETAKAAEDSTDAEKAAADAKAKDDAAATEEPADDKVFTPSFRAAQVEDYDAKLDALTESFEKGDITLTQYNRDMSSLVTAKTKADIAEESNRQSAEQRWDWEIDRFMDDAKEQKELGNIDYRTNKILQASLDAAVKDLASKEENANRTGRWYLMEAHKQVMGQFGRSVTGESSAEDKAAEAAAAKAAGRRPDLKAVPKTLGGLPAASPSETGTDNEFSSLDKLDGLALERAIAKMTPEQADRYAQNG